MAGASAYPRAIDFARLRAICDEAEATLVYIRNILLTAAAFPVQPHSAAQTFVTCVEHLQGGNTAVHPAAHADESLFCDK